MRLVIFEGTREEFEAVRPLTKKGEDTTFVTDEEVEAPQPEEEQDGQKSTAEKEKEPPTYKEALQILRYHGGPSQGQQDFLRVLFDRQGPVHSSIIRDEYGWSNARFRGIRANFPRRVKGALGHEDVFWVKRDWDSEKNENKYSLPETVRKTLSDELGW